MCCYNFQLLMVHPLFSMLKQLMDLRTMFMNVISFLFKVISFEAKNMLTLELPIITSYSCCQPGAKNIVKACRESKVKHLIYNSSADVVFDGSHHIRYGDESMKYPSKVSLPLKSYLFIFNLCFWNLLAL